jgi:hypothetical protein
MFKIEFTNPTSDNVCSSVYVIFRVSERYVVTIFHSGSIIVLNLLSAYEYTVDILLEEIILKLSPSWVLSALNTVGYDAAFEYLFLRNIKYFGTKEFNTSCVGPKFPNINVDPSKKGGRYVKFTVKKN